MVTLLSRPALSTNSQGEQTDNLNDSELLDQTHRNLRGRHIQLIAIGGAIGTILFVQIGFALPIGGPGSLLVAFIIYSTVVLALNNCMAEMVTWMPISSPAIRYCDRFLDPALGFCAGFSGFLSLALSVPFEIAAFSLMLHFWTDQISPIVVIVGMLMAYILLNIFAVGFYGESEFWLASGKVILILGLMAFTVVVMAGGNPLHDTFGFRNWDPSKVSGAPFVEYLRPGTIGRLHGFLGCLIQAAYTISGPEYLAMTAGEAARPRKTLPQAFKGVVWRLGLFFIMGAFSVGVLVPHNDPILADIYNNPPPGAGSSPYVIAMNRLHIAYLPHFVNVLIMLSIFSAGNTYFFFASRVLFGLALEGKAPRVLTRCTKSGIPIYCVAVTVAVSLTSLMLLSNSSSVVLKLLIDILGPCGMIQYALAALSYIQFFKGLRLQGISRDSLPYKSPFQPFSAYYVLVFSFALTYLMGYAVFVPGNWSLPAFLFSYAFPVLFPIAYVACKLIMRTKWRNPAQFDFFEKQRQAVDEYELGFLHCE